MYLRAKTAGVAAVGAGIVAAMMAITPAMAGPMGVNGITTQIITTTVTATGTGEADATCLPGELLVGGGYVINDPSTDWRINLDAPTSATTWTVEPFIFSTQPLTFSAYAICAMSVPGKPGVSGYTTQVVQAQVDALANQTAEADATCPPGDLRTGGGYDVYNDSSNWSIFTNGPLNSDAWNVEIDNEVPLTTTFDSFAVCLARTNSQPIKNLKISTVDAAATVPANSAQTADVSCGSAALMTGGGHEIQSIGQDWSIQASAPVSSNDWQVQVTDLDAFSRVFDTFAVCLKG